ncbi:hypothetical protein Tco_0849898 [Tanacetum coccineum]
MASLIIQSGISNPNLSSTSTKLISFDKGSSSEPSVFVRERSSFSVGGLVKGDENPIHTLGDYSKPSHEGYRNTIELPEGNNVVPLRSDTIRLVQNGCSFYELRSENPNQHIKDFLKLVDSLDLDVANRVPHHGIELWLQVQIFYDRIDEALKKTVDYAAEGRLRKLSAEKAWATIEKLAQYKDEGWNNSTPIHSEDNIDWEFLVGQGLGQAFFESINNDPFSGPQWVNLFRINEHVYQELVSEFFASFEFDASPCRYNPEHSGVRESATLSGLGSAETVKESGLLMEFWPNIGDGGFNEDDEAEEANEGEAGNEGAGGSADMYRNMSQGDWQEERANWMYDHTVRQFQHLSTRDNLDPHLQIDPFPGREADYPPFGYHGPMPLGYAYRPYLSYDSSS